MAEYSSTLRYTGLSGVDTEGMVRSLMNAESIKYNNFKAAGAKLQWKQDAYRSVASALKTFQSSFLDILTSNSMSSKSTFNLTASTVKLKGTVSSAATVKTTSTSVAGKHTLEVIRLAERDSFVGGKVDSGTIEGKTKISDLLKIFDAAPSEPVVPGEGEEGTGEVPPKTLADYENGAGFRLTVDGVAKNITLDKTDIAAIKGTAAGDKADKLIEILNDKIDKAFGTTTVGENTLSKASFSISAGNTLQLTAPTGHNAMLAITLEDQFDFLNAASIDSYSQTNLNLEGSVKDVLGLSGGSIVINGKTITYQDTTTLSSLIKDINSSGAEVKLSFDSFTQKFKMESASLGASSAIDTNFNHDVFKKLGLSEDKRTVVSTAGDAVFKFDDVLSTRSSNNFTISGLSITLNSTTATDEKLDIEVVKDTSSSLEAIKKFVTAYNALISDMNGMTSQSRAKKSTYSYYEPLTDEQRESMTESQIDKWESKAKEGILKNDDILSGITSSMRTMLYKSVELPDKREISLYEIGITTSINYRDKGKLIIDETKLAAMLEERPDDIAELFAKTSNISYLDKSNASKRMAEQGLSDRINDIINNAISGKGTISQRAGIKGEMSEFTSDLYYRLKEHGEKAESMLKYLTQKETNYYSMFSKMEAAMTKANSQASYLASQLGV